MTYKQNQQFKVEKVVYFTVNESSKMRLSILYLLSLYYTLYKKDKDTKLLDCRLKILDEG